MCNVFARDQPCSFQSILGDQDNKPKCLNQFYAAILIERMLYIIHVNTLDLGSDRESCYFVFRGLFLSQQCKEKT
jgi:hypothetical protein